MILENMLITRVLFLFFLAIVLIKTSTGNSIASDRKFASRAGDDGCSQ